MRTAFLSSRWALLVGLLFAVGLRSVSLADFHPIDPDELSWLMSGTSLWQSGVPRAWTIYSSVYAAAGVAVDQSRPAPFFL